MVLFFLSLPPPNLGYLPPPKMAWVYIHPHQKWATTPTKNGLPPPPKMGYEILFYYLKNKYSALRLFFELRFDDLRKTSSNRQLKIRSGSDGYHQQLSTLTHRHTAAVSKPKGKQSKRIRHTARPMVFISVYRQTSDSSKAAYSQVQTLPSHNAQQAKVNTQTS